MPETIKSLEQEAHQLLGERKYQEAAERYLKAAKALQKEGQHQQAAICLASAAGSTALIFGEQTFHRIASLYEEAAQEAEISSNFEYASMLYKYAAVSYERDHDYNAFSECFFNSKESYRRFLVFDLFNAQKVNGNVEIKFNTTHIIKRLFPWCTLTFSSMLWGHGERPHRTVIFGFLLILLCSVLYTQGHLIQNNIAFKPNLLQATYLSFTTFIKVGFEDMSPIGFNKAVAVLESFAGIFTFPIFITGLCRKYLRF